MLRVYALELSSGCSPDINSVQVVIHRSDPECSPSETVASQRVQIALYSLQMQDSAVARATRRLDDIRNKCAAGANEQSYMESDVQRMEGTLNSAAIPATESKEMQIRPETKKLSQADASTQVRTAEAKVAELQDRIERLDKTLEKLGSFGK